MNNVRNHSVITLAIVGAFVIGIFLASGLGTALAGGTRDTSEAAATQETSVHRVEDLSKGKIYMRSLTIGFLMDSEQETQLLSDAKTSEWNNNSRFTNLAETGHEVTDPQTGLTFVVEAYKESPNFVDGITKIYDVNGISLSDMGSDRYGEEDFVLDQTVETSFGKLNIYRMR